MPDTLARAACGTAAVDLTLPTSLQAGETVRGTVELLGGARAERIEELAVGFTTAGVQGRPAPRFHATVPIAADITVHAADHRVLDAPIPVPVALPTTLGGTGTSVGLVARPGQEPSAGRSTTDPPTETDQPLAPDGGMAGSEGVERPETWGAQPVTVRPDQQLGQVLDAVAALGFFLVSAVPLPPAKTTEGDRESRELPRQEFRFRPRWGPYERAGDLYLYPAPAGDELRVDVGLGADGPTAPTDPSDLAVEAALTVRNTDRETVRADLEAMLERLIERENR